MHTAGTTRLVQSFVNRFLKWHQLGPTAGHVGGNNGNSPTVHQTFGNAFSRKTTEQNHMHRTNTGAGQHGHHSLGHHGQADGHTLSFFHPQMGQGIGQAANTLVQHAVGDFFRSLPPFPMADQRNLITPVCQIPVDTADRHIQLPVLKPPD